MHFQTISAAALLSLAVVAQAASPQWQEGQSYPAGTVVSDGGQDYQSLLTHTAYVGAGWRPANTPTLWRLLSTTTPSPSTAPSSAPTLAPTSLPTASPVPTPNLTVPPPPTPTPVVTPLLPPHGQCAAAWQSGVYTAGQLVSYQGHNFVAKWWVNTAPSYESWGAWKDMGTCLNSSTPAPTPVITASPTSTPTATPSAKPSIAPTAVPTPSASPRPTPSVVPTAAPTASPAPTATPAPTPTIPSQGLLFDDFSYSSVSQLGGNGWQVRSWGGGPGFSNGSWSPDNLSFVPDPANPGNVLLRMKARTNASGDTVNGNTLTSGTVSQAELSTQEAIYLNGTWAARMYMGDEPVSGPDGDMVVNAFFGITQYLEGAEPYSEIDFEYLPNGGWGKVGPTMWSGTYEIAAYDALNHPTASRSGSLRGWHTLLMNVSDGYIRFYVDGELMQDYSGIAQPDHPMYLALQIWLSNASMPDGSPGLLRSTAWREYQQDVDWVFYLRDQQLDQIGVEALVQQLRRNGQSFLKNIR
ncbi:carbohydrate-binding protein [Chitinibacter tainanensis]|uniref:carbohydrate-binding protein n=1 Tax=Chitinibacter tainanensis TaxID=230667 RepID=UPI0023553BB7|nr:carbohydrate-binding protein [Chitinibacter tainanensis]